MTTKTNSPYSSREEAFAAFGEHVSRGKVERYKQFGFDAVLGRREGPFFYDAYDERRWWNCHCNGGVFNLGHRHPRVVEAVRAAFDELDIGNHHLVSGWRARLAERLAATTGGLLPGVVFGVGGGEAVDLAIKVTRWATKRQGVVSVRGGYHGHTGLAVATGDPEYRELFGPNLPGFEQVPFDDLEALDRALTDEVAAVILEPIPATLGMPIASPEYLPEVARLCQKRGARLILDEVQTGLGRTGRMWCYQHHDIEPDVVVTGKGLSGGLYPISATLMRRDLHALFDERPFVHISTFGGAEIGCVAGLAALDVTEEPGFLDRVSEQGERFERHLGEGLPFELRRAGMMMGLKFPAAQAGMFACKLFFDRGVFCVWANNDDSVTQFLPPLTLSDAEVDELCAAVRGAFGK